MKDLEHLKYPIGKFKFEPGPDELYRAIGRIESLPVRLAEAVQSLSAEQLDTPYREGGWTLRQVVHHIPDSHMNAYVRFKLAITEFNPTIRPYDEASWAECEEAKNGPVELSLDLLISLHSRWVAFLRSLKADDFARTYFHPANNKTSVLGEIVSMYAWHGDHHLAHITGTVQRNEW